MAPYKNISTALGLVIVAMASPGLAAEKLNGLKIKIASPSSMRASTDNLLQQLASEIIIARLSRDGHHIRIISAADREPAEIIRRIGLKSQAKRHVDHEQISIRVKAGFKLRNKTYTRHASLHLETVIRNPQQNRILGRYRASAATWRVPENCDADCVIENAHQRVKQPARQLARAISRKLKSFEMRRLQPRRTKITSPPSEKSANSWFTLTLSGFDNTLIREIEDFLIVIPGNDDVRRAGTTEAATRFAIRRHRHAPPLKPFLQKMLNQLGSTADITRKKSEFTLNARLPGKSGTSSINW